MPTDTCKSVIVYQNADDLLIEPFLAERQAKAEQMFTEGKTEFFPNKLSTSEPQALRSWVDHTSAQEFIDFVLSNAPTYNVTIESTSIVDL